MTIWDAMAGRHLSLEAWLVDTDNDNWILSMPTSLLLLDYRENGTAVEVNDGRTVTVLNEWPRLKRVPGMKRWMRRSLIGIGIAAGLAGAVLMGNYLVGLIRAVLLTSILTWIFGGLS